MKLIDKDALVAEIDRLKDELKASDSAAYVEAYIIGAEHTIKTLSDVINTIEVKEVDLEEEINTQWNKFVDSEGEVEQFSEIAKHFFELGLKVRKEEAK